MANSWKNICKSNRPMKIVNKIRKIKIAAMKSDTCLNIMPDYRSKENSLHVNFVKSATWIAKRSFSICRTRTGNLKKAKTAVLENLLCFLWQTAGHKDVSFWRHTPIQPLGIFICVWMSVYKLPTDSLCIYRAVYM